MPAYKKKRRVAKSYRSGIVSAQKKGIRLSTAMRKEIKDIAKLTTEQVAEKKDFGFVSESGLSQNGIVANLTGATNNQFNCIPPIWMGPQAFQRIGSQVKIHDFRVKAYGYVELDKEVVDTFPQGILVDIRVFSVKGYKNGNQYAQGNGDAEFQAAVEKYMFNPYTAQTGTTGLDIQYKPIEGRFGDDFIQVNKDVITEHYKKTILLDTSMISQTAEQDFEFRNQQRRSTFQVPINLAPYVAKQWKYDPTPTPSNNNSAARYPTNALIFIVTTFRDPQGILDAPVLETPIGYVKYVVKGSFTDI